MTRAYNDNLLMLHPNSAQGQRHIWCYIGTFPISQHKLYGFYLQFEFSVHKMIKKTAWNTKWGDSLTFCFASHVPYMVIMMLLFIIMEGVMLVVDSRIRKLQLGPFCHHWRVTLTLTWYVTISVIWSHIFMPFTAWRWLLLTMWS